MAEAEDVILDAAHHATATVMDFWKRHTDQGVAPELILSTHRPRLVILLRTLFEETVPVRTASLPARPTVLTRLFTRIPQRIIRQNALPAQDGRQVFLPKILVVADWTAGDDETCKAASPGQIFKIMAVQQVSRCLRRRAHERAAGEALPVTGSRHLLTYLFGMSEAANADAEVIKIYPGLQFDLHLFRRQVRLRRPDVATLEHLEAATETLYQALLDAAPGQIPAPFEHCATAGESLTWARAFSASLRPPDIRKPPRFFGITQDEWLGQILAPEADIGSGDDTSSEGRESSGPKQSALTRRPQVREKSDDEDDDGSGIWMIQPSPPMEHAEDPMGMQRPVDREEDADSGGLAESLAELEETAVVSTPEQAKEILAADEAPDRRPRPESETLPGVNGIRYPEWCYSSNSYRADAVMVRLCMPEAGSPGWVKSIFERNGRQLAEIRRRFESLRPQRQNERRQLDGADIDIGEYIAAFADRQAGLPMSERLYVSNRPQRRDCAVLLLIDISGSTDAWIGKDQRIIDIAKESLVLVTSALDALGDPFAIQAFSGEGPHAVRVTEVKSFEDRADAAMYQRIGALEPDRFTRSGTALRHATASLMKQSAQRRLLLILSDGKPNDIDHYESRYGVEDTRQAVREAVMQGIHPFCITIDREAPDYMPHMYGPGRYGLLSQVQKLPQILLDVRRHFVRS